MATSMASTLPRRTGPASLLTAGAPSLLIVLAAVAVLAMPSVSAAAPTYVPPFVLGSCALPRAAGAAWALAYDPANHLIYVSTGGGLFLVNPPCTNVRNFSVAAGGGPQGFAYDPQDRLMYATDWTGNQVSLLNGTAIVANITGNGSAVFDAPTAITYDPAAGAMIVSDSGSWMYPGDNITVIRGLSILGNVQVGRFPAGSSYDASDRSLLVTLTQQRQVAVLNASSPLNSTAVTKGNYLRPDSVVYDAADKQNYVLGASGATHLLTGSGWQDGSIYVGNPHLYDFYDPGSKEVLFSGFDVLKVVSGTSVVQRYGLTRSFGTIFAMTYDSSTGNVYFLASGHHSTLYEMS